LTDAAVIAAVAADDNSDIEPISGLLAIIYT
jgi:hypothetical protein